VNGNLQQCGEERVAFGKNGGKPHQPGAYCSVNAGLGSKKFSKIIIDFRSISVNN